LEQFGKIENGSIEIYEDREGTIWLGTEVGLRKIKRRKELFETYLDQAVILGEPLPLGHSMGFIVEDKNGQFFANQSYNSLFHIDPITKAIDTIDLEVFFIAAVNEYVYLTKRKENLYQIRLNPLEIQESPLPKKITPWKNGLNHKIVLTSNNKNGIFFLDTLDYSVALHEIQDKPLGDIEYIYEDKENQIVWASMKEGILKVSLSDLSSQFFNLWKDEKDRFVREFLRMEDELWIATLEGLKVFDVSTQQIIKNYSVEDGLPHNTIYSIVPFGDNLWLGTHNGLCCFNLKTTKARNFYVEDGLTHNEFNTNSFLVASDGKIWMGGSNGLNVFHPNELLAIPFDSTDLLLTKFTKYNTKKDSLLIVENMEQLNIDPSITIQPHDQSFTFQFFNNTLTNPNRNQYYWYLDGYEPIWQNVDNKPIANYQNVPVGHYTLRVKATDFQGNPSRNELAIPIYVRQIWYKTWWAWLLYVTVLGSSIWWYYRLNFRRQLVKQEALRLQELDTVKTRLYTNITHEFRTPLTVMIGIANQLQANPKQVLERAGIISRNGQNLLNLVNQMLSLSKLEAGKVELKLQYGDLILFCKTMVDAIQGLAQNKNIQLHFLTELDVCNTNFDSDKLQMILTNLLSNAIKFTPKDGEVFLTLKKNHQQIIFQVKDTGMGITAEKLPFIFDRFYQTDDSHSRAAEGTGIGLSLVRELVKVLEGEIDVKSKIGEGTEFTIHLPLTEVHQSVIATNKLEMVADKKDTVIVPATKIKEVVASKTELPILLIIEDNADIQTYLRSTLNEQYDILLASDGQEGIEKAVEYIPDLIISDVMMPKKDGFEVVNFLKNEELTSHIPIILLTAKADIDSKLIGLKSGADAYLSKPFHEKELRIRLEKLLELRRKLQKRYTEPDIQSAAVISSIATEQSENPLMSDKENIFLQKIQKHIHMHLSDNGFGKTQLAQEMFMSESQLYRKLKALTDKSTSLYIRSIRLQKAHELLRNDDMKISDVAYEVGFKNLSWFSRAFSEEFGQSPNSIRN